MFIFAGLSLLLGYFWAPETVRLALPFFLLGLKLNLLVRTSPTAPAS